MPFRTIGAGAIAKDQTFPLQIQDHYGWKEDVEYATSDGARDRSGEESSGPCRVYCGGNNTIALVGPDPKSLEPNSGEENLWIWGSGMLCGLEPDKGQPVPKKIKLHMPIFMVAIGAEHCLAISANQLLFTWGAGGKGQLGTGTLKEKERPQQIPHPADVIWVAAGDEHSACITQGGECYTWGNADGGRLGLGSTMSEGMQLMPKMIERFFHARDENGQTDAGSVLLKRVSCGAQHTALISDHHQLLTFGMGWFGRLGHGNLDNQYAPHLVDFKELSGRVYDVSCGAYHTYIIDSDAMLWAVGRETCICCDGLGHQATPLRFEPFWKDPRRCIVSLATHEQHTLAVAQKVGDPSHELWVWGRNNRGQLGIPEELAPRIHLPWQLKVPPEWEEDEEEQGSFKHEFNSVATGPGHSMCIVTRTHLVPRRRREHKETFLYAWGCSGSGRLGISKEHMDRAVVSPQAEDGDTLTAQRGPWGSRHMKIFPPTPVDDRMWRPDPSEDLRIKEGASGRPEEGYLHNRGKEESKTWLDIQVKIAQEDEANKPKYLIEQSKTIGNLYAVHMANIRKIWSKGDKGEITEYNLRMRMREVETEYIRTLQALKVCRTMFAPKLENRGKTDVSVRAELRHFEELFWILQQQPLYLRNVARLLWNKKEADSEVMLFHRVTSQIYTDLSNTQTRNLLKSLLRVMIDFELQKYDKADTAVENLFHPTKSRVAPLLTHMCTHPCFTKDIINPIMDPDNEHSLVSMIIEYTLVDPKKARKDGQKTEGRKLRQENYNLDSTTQPLFTGLMATHGGEYDHEVQKFIEVENLEQPGSKKESGSRQFFQTELHGLYMFCHKDNPEDEADNVMAGKVSDFLKHFIHHTLKKCRDVSQLLVHTYDHLTLQTYAISKYKEDDGSMAPGICGPLVALLLGSVLGGVLGALDSGPFGMLRWRVREKVKKEVETILSSRGKKKPGADDGGHDGDWESYAKRVFWNIKAVSKMFYRSFHADMYNEQYAEYAGTAGLEREKETSRTCADKLSQVAKAELLKAFNEEELGQDDTEMDLTVDLYRAHLSLSKCTVNLPTEDMLEFTNLLWRHMDDFDGGYEESEGSGIRLDVKEKDRIYLLLEAMRPVLDSAKEARKKRSTLWGEDQLNMAKYYGEKHNFIMKPRFLEFPWEGDLGDPTFCEESQAPIPRYISNKRQKMRGGSQAVKPLRTTGVEDNSKEVQAAFSRVEEILQELSCSGPDKLRYRIRGCKFDELQVCFSEFQRKIQTDIEEKHLPASYGELLRKLAEAKTTVEHKLMGGNIDETALLQYLDHNVRKRKEYAAYLSKINKQTETIEKAFQDYNHALRHEHTRLMEVRDRTRSCEVPEGILSKAEQHSETLTFSRCKRIKLKAKSYNPTPAQLIFDQTDNALQKDFDGGQVCPSRTFTLKELERRGLITRLNQKIPKDMQKELRFTFTVSGEGCEVSVLRGKVCIKEFKITRDEIQLMESAGRTAVIPYPRPSDRNELRYDNGFLWMHSFRLRRLLAVLTSEGGLMGG
jgi:alpha-tubulin suppressor-like RCC1 family protein